MRKKALRLSLYLTGEEAEYLQEVAFQQRTTPGDIAKDFVKHALADYEGERWVELCHEREIRNPVGYLEYHYGL